MNLFSFKRPSLNIKSIDRILLVEPLGLGDALLMTPTLRSLKESGVKQIDLLIGSRTRAIFEHNPHVSQIFEWDRSPVIGTLEKWKYFKRVASLFRELWKNRHQVMFDFSVGSRYAFLSWLFLGIPIRIGFNFKNRGFFFDP